MRRFRQTISLALVLAIASLGLVGVQAQTQYPQQYPQRPNRMNDRQVGDMIRRLENSTDRFRGTVATALNRSRYQGTRSEDNINQLIQNFEAATDQLKQRFNSRASVASDVENVLRQAAFINNFMTANRLTRAAQSDWALVRTDLDSLARAYNVTWNWDQTGTYTTPQTSSMPYRMTDQQVDALIRRVENGADRFSQSLRAGLNRSTYDGTRAEDNINQFVQNFETSTDQLRSRFDARRSVASDVENVLRQATYIDSFMTRHSLTRRAENDWSLLKTDLNELASAYSVAWTWDARTLPYNNTTAGGNYGTGTGTGTGYGTTSLTGTYRLDLSRSDNPNAVTERAVRTLPLGERQRISEQLMRRLESPEMLAIDRSGQSVTIASSRAPQTTFRADGVENREQMPNGSYARVTTELTGERLVVRSAGNRMTDFNVTFEPIEGGRRLRVTREIWHDQLGVNPIVVQSVYDRTSDAAQWNVYNGGGAYGGAPAIQTGAAGDFVVPNGQVLTAVMDNDLTTRDATVGQRFTMTVNTPGQYQGAIIEGRVAAVDRSGRVSGRSQVSLDFDSIRMRDGRSYRFAGFIEGARTAAGEVVKVDNEGTVRDDNQTKQTVQRAAIGTAVGAIIGAIAGGGKGAAIGAVVGAGAGAGSVYVQGRDDLELMRGSELTIRASSPNN
ncbi:MAG TPA: YMGG-like glycine zipper-containing protein [Pyrinomonadaceae bacterium]|nr:YMGG-like glycine zipper-containing protein [Pyrinomonadaceae bacterium]